MCQMVLLFSLALLLIRAGDVELNPGPGMDTVLKLDNLIEVHEKLSNASPEWFNLGLALGLSHTSSRNLQSRYQDNDDCLREMLALRLKERGSLTWNNICACLRRRTVRRNDVAEEIEHSFRDSSSSSSSSSSDDDQEDELIARQIRNFDKRFVNLRKAALEELTTSGVTVQTFRQTLITLPDAIKSEHEQFITKGYTAFKSATTVEDIFVPLNFYLSFIDFSLLEHIIKQFGSPMLKRRMAGYSREMKEFRKHTTISEIIPHLPRKNNCPEGHSEFRQILNVDISITTLEDLDLLRRRFASHFLLSHALSLFDMEGGSLLVTWLIPIDAIPYLKRYIPKKAVLMKEVLKVYIDDECIYSRAKRTKSDPTPGPSQSESSTLLANEVEYIVLHQNFKKIVKAVKPTYQSIAETLLIKGLLSLKEVHKLREREPEYAAAAVVDAVLEHTETDKKAFSLFLRVLSSEGREHRKIVSKLKDEAELLSQRPKLNILVIGGIGSGKSTLIENLLGKEALLYTSIERRTVTKHFWEICGMHIVVYETSGFDDALTSKKYDRAHLKEIEHILPEVDVPIFCIELSPRTAIGIVHSLDRYTEIGIDWDKTVFALTFADMVRIPRGERSGAERRFNGRVDVREKQILQAIGQENIAIHPTTSDREQTLLNGDTWFGRFWLDIVEALPVAVMTPFLEISLDREETTAPPAKKRKIHTVEEAETELPIHTTRSFLNRAEQEELELIARRKLRKYKRKRRHADTSPQRYAVIRATPPHIPVMLHETRHAVPQDDATCTLF